MKKLLLGSPWLQFIVWRLGLFLLWPLAVLCLKYQPSFAGPNSLMFYGLSPWIYSWANFDGVHYLTIAQKGYLGTALIQAFFPLYPLITRAFTTIQSNFLLSGLIVSNLSLLVVLFLFKKLLKSDDRVSHLPIWLWLLFPTSFFFGAIYNEALFMVLALASFLLAKKKHWWWAVLSVGLASATRIVGIFLLPALLWEFYQLEIAGKKNINSKLLSGLAITLLGSAGLLAFMFYLKQAFGDPLYFFHVQAEFGAGRQETLIFYPQVVWRSIKILLTARPFDLHYLIYVQEFLAGVGGVLLLIWGYRKVRFSYLLFALPALLLSTLTGSFSSSPRYLLVCFPIFMIASQFLKKHKILKWSWLLISTLLLIINTALFLRGYWVA